MAKCKNCKHLKYKDDGRERYAWCPFIGDNPDLEFERFCGAFKKMTNADRIRSMTDEELIAFIKHPCKTIKEMTYPNRNCVFRCDECIEEWLKEKVE